MSEQDLTPILKRLSNLDYQELKDCMKNRGYAVPRMNPNTGEMFHYQWQSWHRLQRLGLAVIEGMGEAEDLAITELGRLVFNEISRRKANEKKKNRKSGD